MTIKCHAAIIEARFYADISDELFKGASQFLDSEGATYERFQVPGVLEIPPALQMIALTGKFDAYILLGCVIRGETSHYDIVAGDSARAVMDLAVQNGLALGNGILTVENGDQAWVRASISGNGKNKGRDAANAALTLYSLKADLVRR